MATVAASKASVAEISLGLAPAPPDAGAPSCTESTRTCQNNTLPARARPSSVRKPAPRITDQMAPCQAWPLEASSISSLPMKPGKGGKPAAEAAASSIKVPSNAGCATGAAGTSRSAASPRCEATSSDSKNNPATTSVLLAR